jgi:hypothetical protein
MNAEQQSNLRQWIEGARIRAGLSPEIPAHAEPPVPQSQPQRTAVAGQVKVEFTIRVNHHEETRVSHVGVNGEPFTIEAADGLIVEAIPTLFDDNWLDVKTTYYERSDTGKRQIGAGGLGTLSRFTDSTGNLGGGSGSVVIGTKAYAITVMATAEPL